MRRTIALAMVCLVAAAAAIGFAGCGCSNEDIASPTSQIDVAKDMSVKASIVTLQMGIQTYIATTNSVPPKATKDVLGGLVDPWPENPWTKTDMTDSIQPGDFTYTPGAGTSYTIVGHLSGGRDYVKP
jgi:hypothetical protein